MYAGGAGAVGVVARPFALAEVLDTEAGPATRDARAPASRAALAALLRDGRAVSLSQPSSVGTPHQAESAGSPRSFFPKAVFGGGGGSVAGGGAGARVAAARQPP